MSLRYAFFAVIGLLTYPHIAFAQFPAKPLRLVVTVAPGGGIDVIARLIAPRLGEALRQPVIVENRPGANGLIGIEFVSKAPPDGYTLLLDSRAVSIHPSTTREIPYDPLKGLEPVAQILSLPYVVVINPKLEARNIRELIDLVRKSPGKYNYAQAGTSTRLSGESFRLRSNIDLAFIPYKGAVPASQSIVTGESHLSILDPVSVGPHIASGRLRALAVTTAKRFSLLPDVPTMQEAGMPDYLEIGWYGVFTSGGSPSAIVSRLNAELNKVVMLPDLAPKIAALGMEPVAVSQEAFVAFYRSELARWKDVVTRAGLPLE